MSASPRSRPVKRSGTRLFHSIWVADEHVLVSQDQQVVYIGSKSQPGTWHRVTPRNCTGCEGWKYRQQCRHHDLATEFRHRWPIPTDSVPFAIVPVLEAELVDEEDWAAGEWVPVDRVLTTKMVPTDAAYVMLQAMQRAVKTGDVSADAPWQLFEFLAAEYLGGK